MEKLTKSQALFQKAQHHLVGGVNSPVRAFRAVGGTPVFIESADGARLTDVDGNTYIDFVGSWGPMILGHNAPAVIKAVKTQLDKGTSYGAPTALEAEMADVVNAAFPSMEMIRFTSSGTEATMSALRVARAVTKRERIVKFEGGYHGHSDSLLVAAGSGATTFGVPSSEGVPESIARNTWVLPYNNIEALENLFQRQGVNVAAVIIEPVSGNMGVVKPSPEFLKSLRTLSERYGAVLIFDEVMTGFRLAWGGAQELFKIKPDITCLGKIIGGGFPVGAFGGSKKIMEKVAPLGGVYQAGTLSGNPVAMAAGLATLKILKSKPPYDALEKTTRAWCETIRKIARAKKGNVQVNQAGSMFTVFFTDQKVDSYLTATQSDTTAYAAFFHGLLDNGVYMPPSQFEAAFVSTEHTPAIMKSAEKALAAAFERVANR